MMSLLLAPSPKPNIAPYCHCERSEAISSFLARRLRPYVVLLPYTRKKQGYVMLNPFGFAQAKLR
ncbi:MAG: hypothetical protein ACNYZI_02540, partial [Anaerolineales bacterium]